MRLRKILAIAITLFWGCMMYSLAVKHVIPEHRLSRSSLIEPEMLALQWRNIEEWNWIRGDGKIRGASRLTIVKNQNFNDIEQAPEHDAYILVQNMNVRIKLPMVGLETPFKTQLTVHLTPEFKVARFAAAVSLPILTMDVLGFIEGKRLYYRLARNKAEPLYGTITLREPLSLLSAIEPMISRQMAVRVGESYTQEVINPLGNMRPLVAKITVAAKEKVEIDGKPQELFRIDTAIGEVTKSRWVNKSGETLRSDLFMGMIAERGSASTIARQFPDLEKAKSLELPNLEDFKAKALQNAGAPQGASPEAVERLLEPFLGGSR